MKTILIHSGGMDSTVLLYQLLAEGHTIKSLSIDYGQRHRKELEAAAYLASVCGVEHQTADIRAAAHLLSGSSLTSPDIEVPEGHYAADNMKATVVPNRNMILLALAAGWAISSKFDHVSYAAHSGDHDIYPDCRQEFTDALDRAIQLADWHQVTLHRPYVGLTKADIAALGAKLHVPFEKTWSCYKGLDLHCGRCGTCIERREAFHLANLDDPTAYAPDAPTKEQLLESNWQLPA